MDPHRPPPRWTPWKRVALWAALLALIWIVYSWLTVQSVRPSALPALDPLPSALPASPPERSWPAPRAIPVPAPAVPASAPVPVSALPLSPDDKVEVCGHGLITAAQLGAISERLDLSASSQRLAEVLLQGDERDRAVGWLLAGWSAVERSMRQEGPTCLPADGACQIERINRHRMAMQGGADGLVTLALASRDPWVYSLAAGIACQGLPGGPADRAASSCSLLTPEQWIDRDADDAAAWLWQARRARERGDTAAVDWAMERASHARRMSTVFAEPPSRMVRRSEFTGLPALQQALLLFEATSYSGLVELEQDYAISRYCSDQALLRHEVRARCERLVPLLLRPEGTLLRLKLGAALSKRLGTPAQALDALDERRLALQHLAGPDQTIDRMFSCAAIAHSNQLVGEYGRLGEVGALSERLQASGRRPAELAAERRRADKRWQDASRAASAAR